MRRLRTRRSIVLFGIGVAVFSALLPSFGSTYAAVLVPLWFVLPAVVAITVRVRTVRRDEQTVSLLSVLLSRAPPILRSFA
jgi:hypothetical protein